MAPLPYARLDQFITQNNSHLFLIYTAYLPCCTLISSLLLLRNLVSLPFLFIMDFPPELWHLICDYLEPHDLARLYFVCKKSSRAEYIRVISSEKALRRIHLSLLCDNLHISFWLEDSQYKKPLRRVIRQTPRPRQYSQPPVFDGWLDNSELRTSLIMDDSKVRLKLSMVPTRRDQGLVLDSQITDPSRITEIVVSFKDPKLNQATTLVYVPGRQQTTLRETTVGEGFDRTLERRLVLKNARWYQGGAPGAQQALPKAWIEGILGKGLHASTSLWKPFTAEYPGYNFFRIFQMDFITDFLDIAMSNDLLQQIPATVIIPPDVRELIKGRIQNSQEVLDIKEDTVG